MRFFSGTITGHLIVQVFDTCTQDIFCETYENISCLKRLYILGLFQIIPVVLNDMTCKQTFLLAENQNLLLLYLTFIEISVSKTIFQVMF